MGFRGSCAFSWPSFQASCKTSFISVSEIKWRIIEHTLKFSLSQTGYIRHEVEFQQNKAARAAQTAHSSRKYNTTANPDAALSDSSAEEDMGEASAAPEPDAGYTYSFDAATGPSKGNEILSQALIKAVKQFETKQTEKLVKEEYEVIAGFKEEGHPLYAAVEDDFELL